MGISLSLYLPCNFDIINNKYSTNTNVSKSSNLYHFNFIKLMNNNNYIFNSLNDISNIIINDKCNIKYCDGFFARNKFVGICDYLIAFTFNNNSIPKPGGTLNTWNKSKCINKIHFNIDNLFF